MDMGYIPSDSECYVPSRERFNFYWEQQFQTVNTAVITNVNQSDVTVYMG
jgi:hypothetical protein